MRLAYPRARRRRVHSRRRGAGARRSRRRRAARDLDDRTGSFRRLRARALLPRDRGGAGAPPSHPRLARRRRAQRRSHRGLRPRRVAARVRRGACDDVDPVHDERDERDPRGGGAVRHGAPRLAVEPRRSRPRAARAWEGRGDRVRGFSGCVCAGRCVLRGPDRAGARRGEDGCGDRRRARRCVLPGRAFGSERANLRASRARGGHRVLCPRERPRRRAAVRRHERRRGGDHVDVKLILLGAVAALATAGPNPSNFNARVDNPWFPLKPGTVYVYRGVKDGKPARDVLTVTHRTQRIDGFPCVVVTDRLYLRGRLAERTTDWYSQDRQGNVWYFGESTAELDAHGHVRSTEGTWRTGRDGAVAGIYMPGHPMVG